MPASGEPELTRETRDYIARTPLGKRKSLGQFFTPAALRLELLDGLSLPERPRILDPACGTGEFLQSALRLWPDARLTGFEIDPQLARISRRLAPTAEIHRTDALEQPWRPRFDAVIGNPPYFEFKPDAALRRRYGAAICGRPNTYACFVLLGLELLEPGGVLAFVLPPSMNNGAYFRALRETILATCRVASLRILPAADLFEGANQSVMLLRLVKGQADDGRYLFRRGPFQLFCQHPARLRSLFEGATTLDQLGYRVRTGSVVWNQVKDRLTDQPEDAVRLIWAHNLARGDLDLRGKPGKPAFVRGRKPLCGPAIAVNRVTGLGASARLRAALVPTGLEFLGENHVNVVTPPPGANAAAVGRVVTSLLRERAIAAVRELTGNTQISSLELQHLVPLEGLKTPNRSRRKKQSRIDWVAGR